VGKTIYLLSDFGKQKAINERRGGAKVPKIPNRGSVCLAVGALNLNFWRIEMQAKNIKFFTLM
jgi:hypothetical protein